MHRRDPNAPRNGTVARRPAPRLGAALAAVLLLPACLDSAPGDPDAPPPDATDTGRDALDTAADDGPDEVAAPDVADVIPDAAADPDAPDVTPGDAADARDACRPVHCDCRCAGSSILAGPCCQFGRIGRIEYRYPIGPDGCPGCTCGFVPERDCAEGCTQYGPDRLPACFEDLLSWCGNGWIDEWETCEPDLRSSCEIPGCPVSGRVPCDEHCAADGTRCEPAAERCGNAIDDDCDGATDEHPCPEACCTDRADDDGDGFADCEDPDCLDEPSCTPCREGPEICWDDCDNDLDCRTDADDSDCPCDRCADCSCRPGPEQCDNWCDDDRDGAIDCDDPDCTAAPRCAGCSPPAPPEEGIDACRNALDDDCDGFVDCSDDSCCRSEPFCDIPAPEHCSNGIDDDFDMEADCDDYDCACWAGCLFSPWAPEDCANALDDDRDGHTDAADPDCPTPCP